MRTVFTLKQLATGISMTVCLLFISCSETLSASDLKNYLHQSFQRARYINLNGQAPNLTAQSSNGNATVGKPRTATQAHIQLDTVNTTSLPSDMSDITGVWKNTSEYGLTTVNITATEFTETFKAKYGYTTRGKIVFVDNVNHIFVIYVTEHSEVWGQYQVGKYARHSWHVTREDNGLPVQINYSGALNFFPTVEEALQDTDPANGAADAVNGRYIVLGRITGFR